MPEDPPRPTPDEEPETYDLAFDPEEDQPEDGGGTATADPHTGEGEKDAATPEVPRPDPRAGNIKGINRSSTTPDAPAEMTDAEEPVAVSPAKAMARREEQRLRAAQELAEADARKKHNLLLIGGAVLALIVTAWIVITLL